MHSGGQLLINTATSHPKATDNLKIMDITTLTVLFFLSSTETK